MKKNCENQRLTESRLAESKSKTRRVKTRRVKVEDSQSQDSQSQSQKEIRRGDSRIALKGNYNLLYIFAFCLLFITSTYSYAETAPVKIEVRHADKVNYDADARRVVLTGNVHIVRGTMSIKSDKVDLIVSSDEKGIEKAIAEGRVEIADGARRGRSERAVFTEGSSEIVMTGNPRLWSEGNEIEADRITYNINTRSMQAEGKVRGILIPGTKF